MKSARTTIAALLILSAQWALAQNSINGKITDKASGYPLGNASVYIPDLKLGAAAKDDGTYEMKNIPAGTYLLEVSFLSYTSQYKEFTTSGEQTFDFALEASSIDVQEVVVTGVSSATERQSDPVPVSVLGQKELLQNSASNLIDAITIAPGVSAITDGPTISKPIVRGLGYNRVVVMNDGVRQEGNQWGDEFGIEVDEYTVHKVEILKGPASLSYGSDAMAGVINFIDAPTRPEGRISGNVLANYQTNNGLLAESFNIGGNQKGFTWDLRYTNKMAHAYKNKYDGYVWNSAYGESDLKAVLGLNRKWGWSRLTLSYFDLKLGIVEGARDSATGKFTQNVLIDGEGGADIAPASKYTDHNFYTTIHQLVRHYKAVWDNSFALGSGRLGVRLGSQQSFRQEANDITLGDVYNNFFYLRTLNYDARYIFPEKNHFEMSVGMNGMQQKSEDRGTVFLIPEYSLFDAGLFAIGKKTSGKLTVSGGLRYDVRTLKANDLYVDSSGVRIASREANSVAEFTAYTSNFSGLSGSIGASYDINEHVYVKANIARGYRAPTAAESGANGIHDGTPFYEIGDHELNAESSLQFDGTFGMKSKDVTAELNGFVNNINDYIFVEKLHSMLGGDSMQTDVAASLTAGPAYKYRQGDATLSGGELVLDIHPSAVKWLHFDNSFSMVNAVQKNQPDPTKYLPYTPPYKLRSELKFMLTKNEVFRNAYIKVGMDYYFQQDKIHYKYGDETVTPGYTLINAGIGSDIRSKKRTICSLYIYASNIADEAYQSNMSRLKYGDTNNTTGRIGVFNMGRNISFKLVIPFDMKK